MDGWVSHFAWSAHIWAQQLVSDSWKLTPQVRSRKRGGRYGRSGLLVPILSLIPHYGGAVSADRVHLWPVKAMEYTVDDVGHVWDQYMPHTREPIVGHAEQRIPKTLTQSCV
jgi:hypothetical protein